MKSGDALLTATIYERFLCLIKRGKRMPSFFRNFTEQVP